MNLPNLDLLPTLEEVEGLKAQVDDLTDALSHIAKTCSASRTRTRRLAWISSRANSAINGNDKWKDMDIPKSSSEESQQSLRLKVRDLKAQVDMLRKAIIDATNNGAVTDSGTWVYSIDTGVLDATPAQCLAEIKAQAVEEYCSSVEALAMNQCPTSDECSEDLVVGWKAGNVDCRMAGRKYANQLRQLAKAGE